MSPSDHEMQRALEADGEKLRQLTGEDHGPYFISEPDADIDLPGPENGACPHWVNQIGHCLLTEGGKQCLCEWNEIFNEGRP